MDNAAAGNADQIEFWNGKASERWLHFEEARHALIEPLSRRVLEAAAAQPGERVLDIGCGPGSTTATLAKQVGENGHVLGVDISAPLLARACEQLSGYDNVSFIQADAQTHAFEPGAFDLAFSRFGVMFFADPGAAFANIRAALAPGGRLTIACWRALAENALFSGPLEVIKRFIDLPRPNPDAPGSFSLADEDKLRAVLTGAGFADVVIEQVDETMSVPGPLDEAVKFILRMGPAGAALEGATSEVVAEVHAALAEALAPRLKDGALHFTGSIWVARGVNR
jgi:SAM-dependent methyltransferase